MKRNAGKLHVPCVSSEGWHVQRVKPAGVKLEPRSVDSRGEETETLKPIDKVSLGRFTITGRNKSERLWLESEITEGRATNGMAKAI